MSSKIHLAVFGAHAMDAELMAGGLIAKATSSGHKAIIIHLTRGERGHPTKSTAEFANQLDTEMARAARILGASQLWMGYTAGKLPVSEKIVAEVCNKIKEIRPTYVITHWRGSWHPRHVNTHYIVYRAVKKLLESGAENSLQGLFYGENCEDLEGFNPKLYVEISKNIMDTWFRSVKEYELFRLSTDSETVTIPYLDYYTSMAKIRGLESGVSYAQAFMEEAKLFRLLPVDTL